jgi:hypothetical protein
MDKTLICFTKVERFVGSMVRGQKCWGRGGASPPPPQPTILNGHGLGGGGGDLAYGLTGSVPSTQLSNAGNLSSNVGECMLNIAGRPQHYFIILSMSESWYQLTAVDCQPDEILADKMTVHPLADKGPSIRWGAKSLSTN